MAERTPYKKTSSKKEPPAKTTMSVPEMRHLLGLKKTDSYWLVKKGVFDTIIVNNQMRVVIASFEKWYSNQVHYHKVDGTPPGTKLQSKSYSIRELADLLAVTDETVYEIIRRNNLKTFTVDFHTRVRKTVFNHWYAQQSKYRTPEDRQRDADLEASTITMPELARMLGTSRNNIYSLMNSKSARELLEIVVVGGKKRLTNDSVQRWLDQREKEGKALQIVPPNIPKQEETEPVKEVDLKTSSALYYTPDEIVRIFDCKKDSVYYWIKTKKFPCVKTGKYYRIPKRSFEEWFASHSSKSEGS